jgi:hypothetical protein
MLAITGQDITAFVGYADGGFDRNASLTSQASRLYGFGVEGLDFGLLMVRAGGQSYTAAKARMDDARLYGFDPSDFELSTQGLSFELNGAAADRSADVQAAADGFERVERATAARYRGGLASLFELEDARRSLLQAQAGVVALQRERSLAWVQLYRSLGGGWSAADLP